MGSSSARSYSSSPFYKEVYKKYERRSDRNERLQERLRKVSETRSSLLGREPNAASAAVVGDAKKPAPAASPMPFNELLNATEQLRNRNQNMQGNIRQIRKENQAIHSGVASGLDPAAALAQYQDQLKIKAERREQRQEAKAERREQRQEAKAERREQRKLNRR
jgi:hypothetical protein